MSKTHRAGWILWCLGLMLVFAAGPVVAQRNLYQFSPRNLKKFIKIRDFMEAGQPQEAERILLSINLKRAKPYGRARVHQMLGRLATMEEEPVYESALEHMKAAVSEEALPVVEHLRTYYFVGQLQTMLGRYDEAVETLEKWIAQVEVPAPSAYYTLAVSYYQAERTEDALEPARLAVEKSDDPTEAWYRLLLSLYLQRSDYESALAVLDDIILKYPAKSYWQQMAAIYAEQDLMGKSLAVQQLAKGEGFITADKDLTRVAQMLMVEGLPHRGAKVMEEGLEDGSIEPTEQAYSTFSNTLLQSREWELALVPLAKAAELKEDGSLFVRLAQVHLQLGRWSDARVALDRAFDRGELSDEGQAHILFGIAAASDKKWSSAIDAFKRAQAYPGTATTAGKWIGHVQRERLRLGEN
ncbi:MAG: tetratricopeptide repeat protein [Myxococcota bacterium]